MTDKLGSTRMISPYLQSGQSSEEHKRARKSRQTNPFDEVFDNSAGEVAKRLILLHGADLLIVNDGSYGTGYVLDETGIWHGAREDVWAAWLDELAHQQFDTLMENKAPKNGRMMLAAFRSMGTLKRKRMVEEVRPMLRAALTRLRDEGDDCPEVTECHAKDLDANTRYLGAANGVIDLWTGTLLSREAGRKALVTVQTPVPFDPAATHPDVDKLLSHLPEDLQAWWWASLGFGLLGQPSRAFYLCVGEPKGGKTTMVNALTGCLGPYAMRPSDDALEAKRHAASAGLSPELEAFTLPVRWAIFDEVSRLNISTTLLKRLSGDSEQTFRRLYGSLQTQPVTASIMFTCNPSQIPQFKLQDAGVSDRLRELPYPVVSQPDPDIKNRIKERAFKQALLARLVSAASAQTPGQPPDIPEAVRTAGIHRVGVDIGEIGQFARRVVKRGGEVLSFFEVWEAWKTEQDGTDSEAGGIPKQQFSRRLREYIPDLPEPKSIKKDGRKVRGWRGWQLVPEDECLQGGGTGNQGTQ